jgi:hypothetical protein
LSADGRGPFDGLLAAAAAALAAAVAAALAAALAAAALAAPAAAAAALAAPTAAARAAAALAAAAAAALEAAAAAAAAFLCGGLVVVGANGTGGREVVTGWRDVVVTDPANLIGAGLVVGEVGRGAVEEVVLGPGAPVGGGVVVEGVEVVVTGGGPVIFNVPTTMTSLSAPAPTEVPLTKASPVKASVQL